MDNYKLGNLICSLREEHGFTQKDFAQMIDVSDKAVSKWENGQAIPRMETLEKVAVILETTVEELIALSRDDIKRVLVSNSFGDIIHFQIDDEIVSLKDGEKKWIIIDPKKAEHKISVYGEQNIAAMIEEPNQPLRLKEKIVYKGIRKFSQWADNQMNKSIIRAKCFYKISNIKSEERIEVENIVFSAGDRMWIDKELIISFPKLICDCEAELTSAECINRSDAYSDFKRQALTSELGISIPLLLIAYPFRKQYFKNVLKPNGLMKHIKRSDYYIRKNGSFSEESKKHKHPILKTVGTIVLLFVLFFTVEVIFGIIGVESDKPYLVASDFSKITYAREEYLRIDDLPKDAISEKERFFGAEVWADARIDGLSKLDQFLDENKVCTFTDKNGNTYLWLITDYGDNYTDPETGEYKEYDDFTEHYVYKLKE